MLKKNLIIVFGLIFISLLYSCQKENILNKEVNSSWIQPLDPSLDISSLKSIIAEPIYFYFSQEGLESFYDLESIKRGDERFILKEEASYNSIGFSDFLGEFSLSFYEIPFSNEFGLLIKINSFLWDKDKKRSREFLPDNTPAASLLFLVEDSNPEIQNKEWSYPMKGEGNKENYFYEAFLTPKEILDLQKYFDMYPEGNLYLNIQDRHYDINQIKDKIIQDNKLARNYVNLRYDITEKTLANFSRPIGSSKKEFTSPWLKLNSYQAKTQIIYNNSSASSSQLKLIIGSFNSASLRNIFSSDISLIFSSDNEVFFLPFKAESLFSKLQNKVTSLLNFRIIPSNSYDFFESQNWKGRNPEFWQINLLSETIDPEELSLIISILENPEANVSLSLGSSDIVNGQECINYISTLLKAINRIKNT